MGEASVVREDTPILKKCVREGQYGREQYLAALQVIIACIFVVHGLHTRELSGRPRGLRQA